MLKMPMGKKEEKKVKKYDNIVYWLLENTTKCSQ
jgi:hypothetical protein